jgi:hypothetical protein
LGYSRREDSGPLFDETQRAALWPEGFRGRVGLDYFSGALVFEERILAVRGAGPEERSRVAADLLNSRLRASTERVDALLAACDAWSRSPSVEALASRGDRLAARGFPPSGTAVEAARSTLELLEGTLRGGLLDAEAEARARSFAFLLLPVDG